MKYKNNHKRWTKEELKRLREFQWHLDYCTGFIEGPTNMLGVAKIVCVYFKRTPWAILRKVYRLRLHRRKG